MQRRDEDKISRAPAATPGGPAYRPHRERRREEGISAGVIYGSIKSLIVPPRQPGEYIDIEISYEATNPKGASVLDPWKIFLVAKDDAGNKEMVKDADVVTGTFSETDSLRLWKMPNVPINLEVRLYAHQEIVPWDWSWW